ncbi:hypothetical protein Pmani_005969 [Petrolisthes manimaculis]|uniref:Uncharacterized protein n=1 Tax=Petrolisthes manimaculis TaxID=1843537 RepID=A0AAE1QCS2_9EUCA|nr:hypothetical protein Pmani_005969 [Petrolisthes manimaculis]
MPETVDTTKGTLYLPPHTLHYGLYSVTVIYNVSMTNEDGVLVWETITGESGVNVGKSDLVVVAVKGGAPRILSTSTLATFLLIPTTQKSLWCPSPGNAEKIREEYGEGGGCWGQGPGMMSNASPNFSISVNLFRTPYITYKIEVATRSKDGRTSGTGVEVEVVEGDVSLLTPLDLSAGGRRSACQSTKADSGEWLCCGGMNE